jgi:hypothetical protein
MLKPFPSWRKNAFSRGIRWAVNLKYNTGRSASSIKSSFSSAGYGFDDDDETASVARILLASPNIVHLTLCG